MKRFTLIVSILFSAISMFAESNNPFLDLFRRHFPNTYSDAASKYIKSFVGDSVYFDIQGTYALHNIFQEVPDTVWIKEKKSKKPKEGKDYLLCYNYKGVRDEKSFYTPASVFDKKPFGLLSIKENQNGFYFPETVGYDLSLVEPETANVIHVILDKSLPTEWKLYSSKTNSIINNWLGKHFYKKADYGTDITKYTFTFGDLYLGISPVQSKIHLKPHGEFILTSETTEPLHLTYESNSGMSYRDESMKILTQSGYAKELEKKKVYSINYELPNDSSFLSKIQDFPFKNIWGKTKSYSSYVSQTINPGNSPLGRHTLPSSTYVLIGDKINVRGTDYYKAVLDGKSFFIKCSDVTLDKPESLDYLLSQPQDVRDAFFDFAKVISTYSYTEERLENLDKFQKLIEKGLVVLEARPYDMSEYTDGTGMKFSFLNTSNKTIKYMTIKFTGYNAVDDPVPSGGKTLLTRKGVGPIDPFETCSCDFDYVWFTDIVDYSKVRSILVEYTNGTYKTYTGDAVKVVPDEFIDELYYKSPVIDFLPIYDEDID